MLGASIYNILSSNIINFIQYIFSIIFNRNLDKIKNIAIKTDVILVTITIIIPALIVRYNIRLNLTVSFIFILLYVFFNYLNNNVHKLYLNKEDRSIDNIIKNKKESTNSIDIILQIFILIVTTFLLYIIGNLLGNTLENLCNKLYVSQRIIGILLGIVTSIPELITFFESQKYHKKNENNMLGVVEATNNLLTSNTLNLFIIESIGIVLIILK